MKAIFTALLLLISSSSFAQVVAVNVFQPVAGGAIQTSQLFQEAKTILTAAGAQVTLSSDLKGIYRFASAFENWEAYGRWAQSLPSNSDWATFQQNAARTSSALQTDNLLLDMVATPSTDGGGPGSVSQVTVWELTPTGTMGVLVEGGMGAKPIHEAAGARVSIFTGGGNRMYYMMNFDNFEAWGKFQDTPNPEFQAYMQSVAAAGAPSATIVDQITLTNF